MENQFVTPTYSIKYNYTYVCHSFRNAHGCLKVALGIDVPMKGEITLCP